MKINLFQPINIEWNRYNGFMFEILNVETGKFEGALFGVYFSENFFYLNLFFINITLFDKFKDK